MKVVATLFAVAALFAWFALGNPPDNVANVLYTNSVAPWENVVGFYYPDKNNPTRGVQNTEVDSLESCRAWAGRVIATSNDPAMLTTDYECGIGCEQIVDIYQCRTTVK